MFKDKTDAEYRTLAELHVDALNHALTGIPAERVRLHVCWGNYEGPHHHDAPLSMVLPIALRANVSALLFESANPRHAHEWRTLADLSIPDDRILIPRVVDSTTNFIEHPELISERLCRFADIVGRERVIGGTDCGFSTFADSVPSTPTSSTRSSRASTRAPTSRAANSGARSLRRSRRLERSGPKVMRRHQASFRDLTR